MSRNLVHMTFPDAIRVIGEFAFPMSLEQIIRTNNTEGFRRYMAIKNHMPLDYHHLGLAIEYASFMITEIIECLGILGKDNITNILTRYVQNLKDYSYPGMSQSYFESLIYMKSQGADLFVCQNLPLRIAASRGHVDAVRFLVDNGADIHAINDQSLHMASSNGHLEIVEFLVYRGADVRSEQDFSITWAYFNHHFDIVNLLASHGAQIPEYWKVNK